MNGIFKLSWVNVKSALMYGLLWGLLAVFVRISEIGDVFALSWRDLLNVGIMAFLAIFIVLFRNFLTNDEGKFVGIQVIPKIEE